MTRTHVLALLQDGKATNGGANDFMIAVDESSIRALLTILKNLEAEGLVSSFDRCDPPEDCCVDIYGYTGP